MQIYDWIKEFSKNIETSDKQVIPRKKNKVKDVRIINLNSLIILNF